MIQNNTMITQFIPSEYGVSAVGKFCNPMMDTAIPTTVADKEDTNLSTKENKVPMIPGMYFPELTVTLTAVPADGATFSGWETKSSYVTDKTALTITIPMTEATTIKATFSAN